MNVRPPSRWVLVEPLTPQDVAKVEHGPSVSSLLVMPLERARRPGKAPVTQRWCRVFALPREHDGSLNVGDVVFCDVTRGSQGPDNEYTRIDGVDVLHMPIADVMAVL